MAGHSRHEEWVAWIAKYCTGRIVGKYFRPASVGRKPDLCRQRGHRLGGQGDDGGYRCSRGYLSVRQSPRAGIRDTTTIQLGARLERVMNAPKRPHALREMRVEMAVENRISRGQVPVATAAVCDFQRVRRARDDHLTIQVLAIIVVRRMQPLMGMLMVNMGLCGCVVNSEFDVVPEIAVIHI